MQVLVTEGDLLDQPVEAIVNAWNRNIIRWWLLLPRGVSGAIKRRAGIRPFREVGRHGAIPLFGAVWTSAREGRDFVWNATNLSREIRGQVIDLAVSYGARVRVVYVETGYAELFERNRARVRAVPVAAMAGKGWWVSAC